MGKRAVDFSVFDADHHLYEAVDAFTRYLPDRYRGAIRYIQVDGRTKIAIKGLISEYIPNPTFDVVARPGAQEDYFRKGNPEGLSYRELMGSPMRCIPAFRNPVDRLKLLDEQGVDRCLMFPTLASLLEERIGSDLELVHEAIHAFNRWLLDEWTFDYEGRIFPTPVITLPIVQRAIEELEWVHEQGAKVVLIRPAPVPDRVGSRSPGLPEFDPFWKRVCELGMLVALHASDSGYARHLNEWEPHDEYTPFAPSAFEWVSVGFAKRPVMDTVAAMICHGALSRHPDLRLVMIENGSSWVRPLLQDLRDAYKKMPHGFLEDPGVVFRRAIHVAPFWEEDAGELCDLIGVDNVLFGSDYPHPEGLAEPLSYADHIAGLEHDVRRRIMGGNLARLMRIDGAA
jgi:predicted TIM-barrel fold metal-dependent hydrolase